MAPPILLSVEGPANSFYQTTRNSQASLRGMDAAIFNKLCNRRPGGAGKDCKPSSIKHDTTRALQFLKWHLEILEERAKKRNTPSDTNYILKQKEFVKGLLRKTQKDKSYNTKEKKAIEGISEWKEDWIQDLLDLERR